MALVFNLILHWLNPLEKEDRPYAVVCQNHRELEETWLKDIDKNFKVDEVSSVETMGVGYDEIVRTFRTIKKYHDVSKINKSNKGGYMDDGEGIIRTINFSFKYPCAKYTKDDIEEEIKKYRKILGNNLIANLSEEKLSIYSLKDFKHRNYYLECEIITNGNFTYLIKDFLKGKKLKTSAEEERDRIKSHYWL